MSGSERRKEKKTFKVALTTGVVLLLAALAIFAKLFIVIYDIAKVRGNYYDSEVILYIMGVLVFMFASGMFLAPVIKMWEKKRGTRLQKNH